ncbi:APC family permease [Anaerostipes sp.]|uniref:APC family permease n=1 Tax=Anaerostipes sp. TaxID=1872530 RepID=UPI0025850DB1|nr:amino acid permease [Anaerostipes sp.]
MGSSLVLQSILGVGMTQYVKLSQLAGSDTPHMIFATNLLGHAGSIWMGLVTVLAGISTLNTILPSTSKIMQGMAEEGMYPKIFAKTNRHGVALAGMCLMCGVVAMILITGYANSSGLSNMILAASCFWLVSYALTHLNVMVLRKRYPEAPRNEKLRLANIPQIIGIMGIIYMIWNISSDMESRLMIYKLFFIIFALLVIFVFCWVKFVMKTKPFKAVPIEEVSEEASKWRKEAERQEYVYQEGQTVLL